jgi:hypothetical protein
VNQSFFDAAGHDGQMALDAHSQGPLKQGQDVDLAVGGNVETDAARARQQAMAQGMTDQLLTGVAALRGRHAPRCRRNSRRRDALSG